MSAYHPYERCPACSGKAQSGTVDLLKYLMNKYPTTYSLGVYNCRLPSLHSCGKALDLGIPLVGGKANTALGDPIVRFLDRYANEFGLMGQIWNRARYDLKTPSGRYYTGPHPHHDHNHIEQRLWHAQRLRYADYVRIAGSPGDTGGIMLGLDIGKTDDPITESELAGSLQVFLVEQGFDLGSFGPNNDGVDMRPGNVTRKALHDWKVQNGITSATSGGEGRIGMYEYGIMLAQGGGDGSHPDSDHSTLATKKAVDSLVVAERRKIDAHINAKTTGPHN